MRKRKYWLWLMLCVILLIALIMPNSFSRGTQNVAREGMAPVQGLVASTSFRIKSAYRAIRGWGGLPDENKKLSEQVVILQNRVNELESLALQNTQLRQQLGFRSKSPNRMIASEVIGRDISGWWQTVRLAKGSRHGIQVNQAVVTADGLVGRVSVVSPRTCDVLLISDPSCRVHAELENSGSYGVLHGKGPSVNGDVICRMDLINKAMDIREKTAVRTSGLGGIFPPDVLIGYVTRVERDASGLYQEAEILPAVDLSELNFVFVIVEVAGSPELAGEVEP
ncbi:MAG: rod shape-determining protein MreC [Kiritimatiellia bacterium]